MTIKSNYNFESQVAELSPSKRELLEKRLRGGLKTLPREPQIPRVASSSAPLSFSQQRLWFIDQLEPQTDAYNVPLALQLTGELDPSTLERCLNEIVRRHEVLRATFPETGGTPVQVIVPFVSRLLPSTDLRNESAETRPSRMRQMINEEARHVFDLAHGPLVRWQLLQLDEQDHVLVVNMHHIVSDGWSLGVFCRELQMLYDAFAQKILPRLPELTIQYSDFSIWQQQRMEGPALQQHLSYWKDKLAGAPTAVPLPTQTRHQSHSPNNPRTSRPAPAAQETIVLEKGFVETFSSFSQKEGASNFMTMLAALVLLLSKWTQQTDLIIGTVVAGRTRREVENLIGCFMNFLPLRTKISGNPTLLEFLAEVKSMVLEAYMHQDCPFEKIVEAVNPVRKPGQNPLYNVGFLLQNFPTGHLNGRHFAGRFLPVEAHSALLDLRFLAEETDGGLTLICEYDTNLFQAETARLLVNSWRQLLEAFVANPLQRSSELQIEPGLKPRSASPQPISQRIAVSATFTAEPLLDSLQFWMKKLELPGDIQFAPYNQVFQQLLDPNSLLRSNQNGLNVVLIRLEDWERFDQQAPVAPDKIEKNVSDLTLALNTAATASATPWLVFICPPSASALSDPSQAGLFSSMESKLATALSAIRGVHLITPVELWSCYPVEDYDEPHANELGHVPYTPACFAALGTLIIRKLYALKRAARKVIALDCDHTLWTGVCGEDGPEGVKIEAARVALQTFMRAQREAGMLLCLCSKNSEQDVQAVFECCRDMPLRPEHFAASRIDWRPKSENLRSLAEELKLGPDSFILVDDNPLECAEAEANCPGVLALQLPEDLQLIPDFLKHAWVFDHLKLTEEDQRRAVFYEQNRQRQQFQTQALSLADFLSGLNLQVQIAPPRTDQLDRVAQLTQRTNQFNFTTRRRSEGEVQQIVNTPGFHCLAVSVRDRFGDYGLVGVIIFKIAGDTLEIDTFLLSCRVLGKGIEHRMLARLGELAADHRCRWLNIPFIASPRNKPASDFLENVASSFRQSSNGTTHFVLPVEYGRTITFNPKGATVENPSNSARPTAQSPGQDQFLITSAQANWIALHAQQPSQILEAIQQASQSAPVPRASRDYAPPRTELEEQLCRMWEQLLRVERVGIRDDFFALHGSSLLAVQVLAQVRKLSGKNLPVSALFQSPTIEQLAQLLEEVPKSSSALTALQPNGSKLPLILVHGAGGGILWGYANLAANLDPDQPVYAIEPQLTENGSARVEDLATRYVKEVRKLQPKGPYHLGGYCFGGYVAYEMARQLLAQGEKLALLLLIDSTAPNGNYEKVNWRRLGFIPDFLRNFFYWLDDFFHLEFKAQREFVIRQLRVLNKKLLARLHQARGKEIHLDQYVNTSELPEHELDFWRLHLRAGSDFVPKPYPGRVTLLRTRSQPLFCSYDPAYGWGELAGEGVDVKILPGSHENIFKEPDVRSLAEAVDGCLAAMPRNHERK